MTLPIATLTPLASSHASVLPLENGDVLTRAEFEQRYKAMPHLKKAELIDGVAYVPSPVCHRAHGRPHTHLIGWLSFYEAHTPGVEASDNSTVRLELDNEPQPDALLLIDPARGGQTRIAADDYIEGAPEFVAEIASSSASYDLHAKLQVCRRNGVREYLVWRVLDQEIDWFMLRDGQFVPLARGADGYYRSTVFPGLWLDPTALLQGHMTQVLAVLQQGLTTTEHADLVRRLQPPTTTP